MIRLSVIIPTRNRAKLLQATLASIEKQTLHQSKFEVIICDNNSTDNTAQIAHYYSDKFQHIRYFKTIEPGLHVGRNKGFQEAKGEILVYVDDDIEAFPNWLYTINEVFQDPEVMLVGGKNLPKWEIPPPDWALEMWKPNKSGEHIVGWFSIIDLGNEVKEIDPFYVWGCNFSVRKKIINDTKGFHPDGMPQEIIEYRGDGESAISAYILQKGYKTIYHPLVSVYHFVSKERLSISYVRKRGFIQGISESYTNIRYPKPPESEKTITMLQKLKRQLFFLHRFLKKEHIKSTKITYKYNKAIKLGQREGYSYHQQKVNDNDELRAWVMKDNYL